jgi:regulator of replication initiation timing
MQLSFEVFDQYLKIHLSGGNLYAEIGEILTTIKRLSEENSRTRILIDAVNVSGLSEMEKYFIGEQSANMFGHKTKAVIVSKPELINKFLENVVVNRGGRLRVLSSEQEALRWLLE